MTITVQAGTSRVPVAGRLRADAMSHLLSVIRERHGEWTVGRAKPVYRQFLGSHTYRATIRRHLALLEEAGHLNRHGDGTPRRFYTLRAAACRCDEPGADPYACEADPEDCTGEFSELNPHGSARPVHEASAEVSRTCGTCSWRTSTWHVDDGSAEAELHDHVTRLHGGRYEKASAE